MQESRWSEMDTAKEHEKEYAIEVADLKIRYKCLNRISIKKSLFSLKKSEIDVFEAVRGISFQVPKGEMSLVGTRPPTIDEVGHYQLHHRGRLGIKPGLTGMWQVSGRNDITDFEKVVALDTQYISEWSLSLDLKILFRTIQVVLSGDGSK